MLFLCQVYYYIVENSEGANYFKINTQTGEISTKAIFDRETKAAYATSFGPHAPVLWAIASHSGRRWTYSPNTRAPRRAIDDRQKPTNRDSQRG